MAKTYLFYDLETSGIHKCFDQIMQFAAIRTDKQLNEIERHEFLVKLNPDTIVDPEALIVHHIPLEKANSEGVSEYEAVQKIHALINVPDTVSVGYNTLGFDDEFLRFSFYRNLLSVYTHQFANDCYRMDLYPLVAAYYLYDHERIAFPTKDGKPSLKLELLNEANQLVLEGRAHDALVDVEVTVALARKLKSNEPMWRFLEDGFKKKHDQRQAEKFKGGLTIKDTFYQQAIMVNGRFGVDNQYHAPVLNLGQHRHYKNQTCWLRLDLPELRETTIETISEHTWVMKKKWGEPPILLPALARFVKKLGEARINEIKENKKWLMENPDMFLAIVEDTLEYTYPKVDGVDIDAALYTSGFLAPWEERLCQQFHGATLEAKANMLPKFEGDLQTRALRLLGRLSPEHLPTEFQMDFHHYLEQIASFDEADLLLDFRGNKRRSVPESFEKIQTLKEERELSDEQLALLDELEEYISV